MDEMAQLNESVTQCP